MDIDQVRQEIESWLVNFVEVPHPALGGLPPCPFARSARLKKSYAVYLGADPYYDLKNRGRMGMGDKEVIIYAYDPKEWNYEMFSGSIELVNKEVLLPRDMLALEDHPDDVEIVNGICMNQGTYALAMIQSLSKLDDAAKQMASKGFYHSWPEEYLQVLFKNRTDPR
jgi:hypothetical protein